MLAEKQSQTAHDVARRVKQAVLTEAPDAEVILFGSRARGNHERDSDWDFLVLTNDDKPETEDAIRDRLFEIELEGHPISCIFRTRTYWNSDRIAITPFHKNVCREGKVV